MSDIIGVYEQKLRAQKTKEAHLDDLVQAKTMELSQADRLIQQYKNRLAQTDAEVRWLLCVNFNLEPDLIATKQATRTCCYHFITL